MRIGIVALDGYFGSAVSSVIDILATAELVRPSIDPSIPELRLEIVAPRRRVVATSGMAITATRTLRQLDDLDLLVVPAMGTLTEADTLSGLDTGPARAVIRALAGIDLSTCEVAAACTGVFLLAETGLLDGRQATTTWFMAPAFRARYPKVHLDLDRMVIADGPVLTAGAAFAHVDLSLALLRRISGQLVQHVARLLLIDERPAQAAFIVHDYLRHDDSLVLSFEAFAREHLDQPFDVATAAQAVGTTRRTLERRTRQVLGMSPLDIVQRLRLERADHLRRTTNLSTGAIAAKVGYANAEALRALRRRAYGASGRGSFIEFTETTP
ncbi:helix-turn-helix domain-containing protein [Streptosporangiaceae bacterium NEAU-GS5]|nr:helix-turn-helix domain-containing protein [Streptosporangiaceae bacterium NEAU-GS5]